MSCTPASCLAKLGAGNWAEADVWRWNSPSCCGFGQVGSDRARELLRGRSLAFIGDSQTRRHMWSVIDSVGGEHAVRRQHGSVVADSSRQFDERAVSINDTIYDSQRAYHAGQSVLLNVDTGKWVLLDPLQLCGIERPEWTADWRLVEAVSRGNEPPWSRMRGSRYRVHFNFTALGFTRLRARDALTEFARFALKGWGCQAARSKDCSFHDGMQRQCASNLHVEVTPSVGRVLLGNNGDCRGAAELVGKRLRAILSTPGGRARGNAPEKMIAAGGQSASPMGRGPRRLASQRRGGRKGYPSLATRPLELSGSALEVSPPLSPPSLHCHSK